MENKEKEFNNVRKNCRQRKLGKSGDVLITFFGRLICSTSRISVGVDASLSLVLVFDSSSICVGGDVLFGTGVGDVCLSNDLNR